MTQNSLRPKAGRFLRNASLVGALLAVGGLSAVLTGCSDPELGTVADGQKVIILGIDGMDYTLAKEMIERGELPNLAKISKEGTFLALETSVPPLSPTAWSDFITGLDSGGHGIFEFLHRNPDNYIPEFAMAKADETGQMQLLRKGKSFWQRLEENGVETSILRMPVNFPPTGEATRELSGMGTPDIQGGYGEFSFYTSELFAFSGEDVDGGEVYEAWPEDGVVVTELHGPLDTETEMKIYLDPVDDVARLEVEDEVRVLQVGEWSDWVKVSFTIPAEGALAKVTPDTTLSGIARFYLRQVRPEFELYVSPINMDPYSPHQQISHPEDYAGDLADATEIFYTQGMPEDTQAFSQGVLEVDEFLAQAKIAGEEIRRQYNWVLDDFLAREGQGLLFYYTGNVDQTSHMMWRTLDPGHPVYDPEVDGKNADVIPALYREVDEMVGYTLKTIEGLDQPGTRLVIMSDHGFASLRREFHVNNWLRDEGYLAVKNSNLKKDPGLFLNVDWSKTRAYAAGLNGFYINLKDREGQGIVDPADKQALLDEIEQKMLAVIDPGTDGPVVTRFYQRDKYFKDAGAMEIGPDAILGFAKGVKSMSSSSLGELGGETFADNTDAWSGDHGMDHTTVPGVLFADRPLGTPASSLKNLATSILSEFGIADFPEK